MSKLFFYYNSSFIQIHLKIQNTPVLLSIFQNSNPEQVSTTRKVDFQNPFCAKFQSDHFQVSALNPLESICKNRLMSVKAENCVSTEIKNIEKKKLLASCFYRQRTQVLKRNVIIFFSIL